MKYAGLAIIAALLIVTVWLVVSAIQEKRNDFQQTRRAIWEGYYHANLNNRYALRLAPKSEHAAEMAKEWRILQSKWGNLWHNDVLPRDAKDRVRQLRGAQDALEEREDPALYDADLMLEVQDELDRCLGLAKAGGGK